MGLKRILWVVDELGRRLWELRKKSGLTQDELGTKIQIDGRQISRYETGKVKPSKKVLARICEFFGVVPEELLTAVEEERQEIRDPELYQQFLALDRMDTEEKKALKIIIKAVLAKHRAQKLFLQEF